MARHKQSFLERLTGALNTDFDDTKKESVSTTLAKDFPADSEQQPEEEHKDRIENKTDEEEEGRLSVDVYQTRDDIIVKTLIAGVRPDSVDIAISRDTVTIKGRRDEPRNITDNNYYHRELYWGGFSRTILLPEEIDVETAEASEHHGLLTLKLPKVDKNRQTKLKIKSDT